ncbi:MAG TPA: hypothetical protein VFK06_26210 [Candidatus Angelobacter sp.]|nr:hypothetical protein [Candidatus Angelobacter sp.]
MNEATQKELVRVLELDYEKTTKVIEGITTSSFTIRGWGITLSSALIGLTFQTQHWEIAVLAAVVTLLIAFVDGYHSWLYAKVLQHANRIETVMRYYYAFLARGDVDDQARTDFLGKLLAHRFGRFTEIRKGFTFSDLREARPRYVIVTLYATLLVCAASGVLVFSSKKHPAATLGCTQVPGASDSMAANHLNSVLIATIGPFTSGVGCSTLPALERGITEAVLKIQTDKVIGTRVVGITDSLPISKNAVGEFGNNSGLALARARCVAGWLIDSLATRGMHVEMTVGIRDPADRSSNSRNNGTDRDRIVQIWATYAPQ